MRYCLLFAPNVDIVTISVEENVSDTTMLYCEPTCDCNDDEGHHPALVFDLFSVAGVVWVKLHRHGVTFEKASVFDWREILPDALYHIHFNLAPDQNSRLDEKRPPRRYRIDGKGRLLLDVLPGIPKG